MSSLNLDELPAVAKERRRIVGQWSWIGPFWWDKDLAWVPAEVTDLGNDRVQVVTSLGKKIIASPKKLLPRDVDADHGGVDDMTKLTYLHEPGVLHNLERRYALDNIYVSLIVILVVL
ncbi:hypothetical protein Droror1_Dr00025302 [Drosera rotundifolia]